MDLRHFSGQSRLLICLVLLFLFGCEESNTNMVIRRWVKWKWSDRLDTWEKNIEFFYDTTLYNNKKMIQFNSNLSYLLYPEIQNCLNFYDSQQNKIAIKKHFKIVRNYAVNHSDDIYYHYASRNRNCIDIGTSKRFSFIFTVSCPIDLGNTYYVLDAVSVRKEGIGYAEFEKINIDFQNILDSQPLD